MDHLSPDRVVSIATDPGDISDSAEQMHLAGCEQCRAEVAALVDLTAEIRAVRTETTDIPPATVWTGLLREIGSGPIAAPVDRLRPASAVRRPRRSWVRPAVAAAAGLLVGAGATLGVVQAGSSAGAPDVVARTALAPVPGQSGTGTAELTRTGPSFQVHVRAELAVAPSRGFHEVWLINADGVRMYALGVLPASGNATFWVPAGLGEHLDGYRTVNISVEPDDGESAHSGRSLVQGQLPV